MSEERKPPESPYPLGKRPDVGGGPPVFIALPIAVIVGMAILLVDKL